jgi:lipopolysaccharide/colanic/teichoic acid biosynthesis glycosyltransferase
MEFSFLPKATEADAQFVRYTIQTPYAAEGVKYTKDGFFYVGKNHANIEKLVKAFKRGYASESVENAKMELKRSLIREKITIPEIIFCESNFDAAAIKSFCHFLRRQDAFSSIPFVLDATNLGESELSYYRKNNLADEIIFLGATDEKGLMDKTQFLKKVKSKVPDLQIRPRTMGFIPSVFRPQKVWKRTFDIIFSVFAILLLSPLFLLIALAIRVESKGPIFYVAKRAGRGYRIFDFYKFRTMFCGADQRINEFSHLNQYNSDLKEGPAFFKIDNDPRVTKIGAFLRNTSLDELPQLFNVLLGDMSLVGNRPLPLYEAATLTTDDCAKRFMAPAGMTGLWQIKKRGKKDMSVEERINLDINYADNCNFFFDLWIMANTPSALFQKTSV